jgi:predicted flap endonuclease-1-like 5' DNA nuclease
MAKLEDVEGIGPAYAEKLRQAGVRSTDSFLKLAATPKGRQELAEKSGINEKMILEWANHLDLYRIKGVGSEYSDLLEEAGVDTVVELAQRNPENLYQKLVEVNNAKKLVRKMPVQSQVADWIEQAKKLPRVLQY